MNFQALKLNIMRIKPKKEHKELLIYIIIFCLKKKNYKAEYADVSIQKRFVSSTQVVLARDFSLPYTFNYRSSSCLLISGRQCSCCYLHFERKKFELSKLHRVCVCGGNNNSVDDDKEEVEVSIRYFITFH